MHTAFFYLLGYGESYLDGLSRYLKKQINSRKVHNKGG